MVCGLAKAGANKDAHSSVYCSCKATVLMHKAAWQAAGTAAAVPFLAAMHVQQLRSSNSLLSVASSAATCKPCQLLLQPQGTNGAAAVQGQLLSLHVCALLQGPAGYNAAALLLAGHSLHLQSQTATAAADTSLLAWLVLCMCAAQ